MKKFALIIPILFLFVGCGNSKNDFFAKKQQCAQYIHQVEIEVDEIEARTSNQATQPEVFYSPKLDTCISAWTLTNNQNFGAFRIENLLTKEEIYSEGFTAENFNDFHKKMLIGLEEYSKKTEELIK